MTSSTLTDKGQTTVPQAVRDALNVKPRQRLEWIIQSDGTALVRPQASALDLFGSLRSVKPFPGREAERKGTLRAVAKQAASEGLE